MKADDFLDDAPTADAFLADVEPAAGGGAAFTYRKPWRGGKLVERRESVLQTPVAASALADAPDPTENARALFNALTTNPDLVNSPMYGAGAAVLERAATGQPSAVQSATRRAQVDNTLAAQRSARINAARESTDQAFGGPGGQALAAPGRRLLSGVASVVGGVAGIPQLFGSDLGAETADAAGLMARANMPEDPGLADEVLSGVGQVGPMAGGGAALRAMLSRVFGEGAATHIATGLMGATGGAMSGGEVLNDLEFRGDLTDDEKRGRALFAAIVSGASGKAADRFLLPGADRMAGGPLQAGGRAFMAESGQEGLDQATQNLVTDRNLSEGVARAALVGGLVGGGTRVAGELGSDASQLAAAIDGDAQAFADTRAPQVVQQPVARVVGAPLPAPAPQPAPAPAPPLALGYDPSVSETGVMVVDNAGNARPMTADEFLEADDVRQQGAAKEMSDAEVGLTPDVRRAQENRSDPASEPAPVETPELVKQLMARGWTPPEIEAEAPITGARAATAEDGRASTSLPVENAEQRELNAAMARDLESMYQADVKDSIRERLGLQRPADDTPAPRNTAFYRFLKENGLKADLASDIYGDNAFRANRALPGVFRKGGMQLDDLVVRAVERGFMTPADVENALDTGGTRKLVELIQGQIRGNAPVSTEMADDVSQRALQSRVSDDLEQQARAIGLDTGGMDDAQVSGALRRIERRRQEAQTRQAAFDAKQEAAIERAAIQDDAAYSDDQLGALDADWLAGDNVDLASAMKALGFDQSEIDHAVAAKAEDRGSAQAPGGNASGGAPGARAADQGSEGRQEGPAAEGLTSYTAEEILDQQDRAAQADKDAARQRTSDDLAARREREQREIEARQDASADNFELGQDPDDSLSGQGGLFSRPKSPTGASTADTVRAALRERFGSLIDTLEQRGFLKVWDTVQDFNDGQSSENIEGAAAGYYDGKTAHLFADGIEPGSELGVFLHEVGEHASMEQMLGPQYSKLVDRAKALVESGDPLAEAADARIPEDTAVEHRDSELLAYLIETVAEAGAKAPPSLRKWLADTLAALRAWWSQTGFNRLLDRYGQGIDLQPADIAALAVRAVRWQAQQTGSAGRGGMYARAYHGTPHAVDKFSTDKVGSGEGAQAFGWGLYFADKKEIADHYRKVLSGDGFGIVRIDGFAQHGDPEFGDMMVLEVDDRPAKTLKGKDGYAFMRDVLDGFNGPKAELAREWLATAEKEGRSIEVPGRDQAGNLYEVEIPEDSEMLLWDKPLSAQPAKVRALLESDSMAELVDGLKREGSLGDYSASEIQRLSGEDFYDMLRQANGDDQKAASDALAAAGIKGIKYLDGGSRGNSNYRPQVPRQAAKVERLQAAYEANPNDENASLLEDARQELESARRADAENAGTYNYVVFSGDDVAIQGRFSRPKRPASSAAQAAANVFGKQRAAFAPPAAPTNPNALPSAAAPWTVAEPGTWDNVVRTIQNNKVDLKRVRAAIEEQYGRIPEASDAYLQEELYHGRVSARVEKLHEEAIRPLLQKIAVAGKDAGVSMDDVNRYLHARHAPERNAAMKAINPTLANNDALSGMSDTDAAKALADFRTAGKDKALAAIAADVDQLLGDVRTGLVADGLEDAGVVQAWEQAYQHYVPLQRDIEGGTGKAQGFSVKGPEAKRATGSNRAVVNILANIVTQAETAAIRAEKSEVGRSLLDMARQYPNPDFWKVDVAPTKPRINPNTGLVERNAVDPLYQTADNVVMVKDYGGVHFIVFNKDNARAMQTAKAMKNLEIQQVPKLIQYVGKATRFMASLLTQRNPEFWFTNFSRDLQGSAIQMNGTQAEGLQAKVMANLPDAFAGIRHIARKTGKATQWARYAEEFMQAGGATGYMQMFDNSTERMKNLQREVDRMGQGKADPRRLARQMLDFIDDYNDVVENGMRLAVFQAAREAGVSTQRAASIAKNITVNFNRKGNATPFVNSLYMFFNAGVQGTARLAEALATSNKARVAVGTLAGVAFVMDMVNRAMAGDDEDTGRNRYDLIPEFEKSRNWIFMNPSKPGSYVKVPLPLGFHVFHNGGRLISDFVGRKDPRNASEYGWAFAGTLIDAFSPVGGVASVSQLIAPSAADPIVQLAENKSFTGGPVYRSADQGFGQVDPKPAYTRHFENTPDVWKGASRMLNDITGGDKDKRGWIDVEPDILRHIFTAITGGPGRAVDRVVDTAQSSVRGQEVTAARLPFSSRFYGVNDDRQKERAYFEDLRRAARAKEDFDHFVKAGRRDLAQEVLKEIGKGDAARGRRVIAEFERSKKDGRSINKRIRELQRDNIDDSAQAEQLAALKKGRVRVYSRALKETATEEE